MEPRGEGPGAVIQVLVTHAALASGCPLLSDSGWGPPAEAGVLCPLRMYAGPSALTLEDVVWLRLLPCCPPRASPHTPQGSTSTNMPRPALTPAWAAPLFSSPRALSLPRPGASCERACAEG